MLGETDALSFHFCAGHVLDRHGDPDPLLDHGLRRCCPMGRKTRERVLEGVPAVFFPYPLDGVGLRIGCAIKPIQPCSPSNCQQKLAPQGDRGLVTPRSLLKFSRDLALENPCFRY